MGDSLNDSGSDKSIISANPSVTGDDAEELSALELLRQQDATIRSMAKDIEVLRHSGSVMEQRLQAFHGYMCDYMGKNCPPAYREMSWVPIITMVDETQVLKGKAAPEAEASMKKKGGGAAKRRRAVLSDDDEEGDAPPVAPPPKRLAVNYDTALTTDTAHRCLYGLKGAEGYCLVYNVSSYFKFDAKVIGSKTSTALKATGVRSLEDVVPNEQHHQTCMMSFVMGLVLHEMGLFPKKRPLFLESPVDIDDIDRSAEVIANVQPEPLRSALTVVLGLWKVPQTEKLAKVFLEIVKTAEGYFADLRGNQPAADFRRIEKEAKENALKTINVNNSNDSSADD